MPAAFCVKDGNSHCPLTIPTDHGLSEIGSCYCFLQSSEYSIDLVPFYNVKPENASE
jgi:ferredoxin-thioredoxin reductase catalytic subunit